MPPTTLNSEEPVTDSSQLDMGEDNKTHNAKNIRSLLLEGLEYRPPLRIVISSCM